MPTDAARCSGSMSRSIVDAGAYALWPNGPFLETGMAARNLPGPYDIRDYRAEDLHGRHQQGADRALSRRRAAGRLLRHRAHDRRGRARGRPRSARGARSRTWSGPTQMPYTTVANLKFDTGDYPSARQLCAETDRSCRRSARGRRSGEPDGRLIGVGFACYHRADRARLRRMGQPRQPVHPRLRELHGVACCPTARWCCMVGIQSHGQGLETTLSQIACEELGIDPARISVRHGDTGVSPFGFGTFASRSIVMAGGAVARTSRMLRDKILQDRRAPAAMRRRERPLRRRQGRRPAAARSPSPRSPASRICAWKRCRTGSSRCSSVTATYEPGIDTGGLLLRDPRGRRRGRPETGVIELLDFAVAEDCGTMINPMIVDGQVRGGVAQGIGTALYEEIPYDEQGQPLAAHARRLPRARRRRIAGDQDRPPAARRRRTPNTASKAWAKAAPSRRRRRSPTRCATRSPPLGAEVNETPLTPRRVLAAIRQAQRRRKLAPQRPLPLAGRIGRASARHDLVRLPPPQPYPASGGGATELAASLLSGAQKNASVRISMLSRGRALGGEVGSSKAVWAVQRARPSFDES